MNAEQIFAVVAGAASIIALFIGGSKIKNKFSNKQVDKSRKKNTMFMFGGSQNQQANGDINNEPK